MFEICRIFLQGILPGGGTALLYASQVLDTIKLDNFDQSIGVRIVRDAIRYAMVYLEERVVIL